MPLKEGSSRAAKSYNIAELIRSGKEPRVAKAIAMRKAAEAAHRRSKRKKR